jgi:FkbM family methyltransferase
MWIPEAVSHNPDRAQVAVLATAAAREALPGVDIEIFWDELWIRRMGQYYYPDPEIWKTADPQRWLRFPEKYLRDVDDYWFHVYKPQAGDVIADIGAGRGEDVFAFSRAVGPGGHVWAIEPHPVSYLALRKFCQWNRLENVTTLNYACVEEPATLQIETMPVWESNYVRAGEASPHSYTVEGRRFDDLQLGRIDFLKMNIEGAERMALPGCRESLAGARYCCVAAHDFRAARGEGEEFRTLALVKEYVSAAGFTVTTRDEDPRYYVPYHVHGRR